MVESVAICIPTFRRPRMLKRLLDAVAALKTDARILSWLRTMTRECLAGFSLCDSLNSYPWPLIAMIAPKRGIAEARNALIEEALKGEAQFIAMIDDDEWPQEDWIEKFLACARATNADVLQGSILFGHGRAADGHGDIRAPSGPIAMLQGAGNVLIRRAVLEEMPKPWFDPAFALSGGEDRDFFVRLNCAGKHFAWSDEARAHGDIPETQRQSGLAVAAGLFGGQFRHARAFEAPAWAIPTGARTRQNHGIALVVAAGRGHPRGKPESQGLPLQKLFRAAGKLGAMAGARYNEYAVIHGE